MPAERLPAVTRHCPGSGRASGMLSCRGMDAVPVKKFAQNARPAHIARQHDHAVAEIPIVRNIVRSGLTAATVGRELLCRQAHERARLDGTAAELQPVSQYDGPGLNSAHHVGKRLVEIFRARGHRAAAHEQGDVFPQLRGVFLRAFGAARRLVDQHGRLRREIVQRRGKRVVHEAHIPVGRREHAVGAELFPVGTQGLGELLRRVAVLFSRRRVRRAFAAFRPARRCRPDTAAAGSPPPAGCGSCPAAECAAGSRDRKKAHGIHIVTPELHAHRLRIRGEKKSRMPPRRENWPGPSTCAVRR